MCLAIIPKILDASQHLVGSRRYICNSRTVLRERRISWTCRAAMHRPHTSPPTQVLSTKDLPWNERDCKREIHNETCMRSLGDLRPFLRATLLCALVLGTHNSTCCTTAGAYHLFLHCRRGTGNQCLCSSLLITRYEPALKHCCARVRHRRLLRRHRAIQVPWLSRDTVPFYARPRCEIQFKSRYDLLWLHKNIALIVFSARYFSRMRMRRRLYAIRASWSLWYCFATFSNC